MRMRDVTHAHSARAGNITHVRGTHACTQARAHTHKHIYRHMALEQGRGRRVLARTQRVITRTHTHTHTHVRAHTHMALEQVQVRSPLLEMSRRVQVSCPPTLSPCPLARR